MHFDAQWCVTTGRVVAGYRVASGRTLQSPYPEGTIALQRPHFFARGLNLSHCFPGTLNISIAPVGVTRHQPEYTFEQVQWLPQHPPETFSFSRCYLSVSETTYAAWIYYPHPETKPMHFQDPSILEVLAPEITGIDYGAAVQIAWNTQAFAIASLDSGSSDC